jgi:3-phenylpropionate/trans-cinnamate dioxygenase ferredoxin reductase subunit
MAHIVIIGGGVAAGTAAKTLRKEQFRGDITVLTEEPHPPYQRPPLSKGYLAGKEGADAVILQPEQWYAEQSIDLRMSTRAVDLDPAAHEVELDDSSVVRYDSALLAMGASARSLPLEGADLLGVRTLRRLDDADHLAAELRGGGQRLVIIGSGWIGMEVGATARTMGNEVTVLERDPIPLGVALGAEMGEVFGALHREHGVDLRTSVNVERITGSERVEAVVVDGESVPADIVLIGVGAVPNTALAEGAGLRIHNGILADSSLRTGAPDVYAAGDVANPYHPVIQRHLRSEHWANAQHSGPVAARGMLGEPATFAEIPYFYTDQFDLSMELSGYAPLVSDAQVVVRGDRDEREFVAFWVDHGRVVAGMNVNVPKVNKAVQGLIRSGELMNVESLRDPSIPLESLLEEH